MKVSHYDTLPALTPTSSTYSDRDPAFVLTMLAKKLTKKLVAAIHLSGELVLESHIDDNVLDICPTCGTT